ncbi:hypothetical protein RDABS01_010282 [Bienertia sinuspersici]
MSSKEKLRRKLCIGNTSSSMPRMENF